MAIHKKTPKEILEKLKKLLADLDQDKTFTFKISIKEDSK